MAMLAVATMVVAMTPRSSGGPVALIATTTPISVRAVVNAPSATTDTGPDTTSVAAPPDATPIRPQATLLTSFSAFPHAVTPGPQLDLDGSDVADHSPAGDAMVFVRTEAVTYRLSWDEAQRLSVPDGSVIFDGEGDLVARVSAGELVSLVGG